MIQYIYFVKCPNCEDEHFDFFDDAKGFALGCLSKKPIITQTEVCRNDFGECTDSSDLGTVWSWEDECKDCQEPVEEHATFTKDDVAADYDPDTDPEFVDDDFFAVNNLEETLVEDYTDLYDRIKDMVFDGIIPGPVSQYTYVNNWGRMTLVRITDKGVEEVDLKKAYQQAREKDAAEKPLTEGFTFSLNNAKDLEEFMKLCDEVGMKTVGDLDHFVKETAEDEGTILDKLREYRAELGPDFKIKEAYKDPETECIYNDNIECTNNEDCTDCPNNPKNTVYNGKTLKELVEEMEENEDEVECTWCNDLFPKDMCRKEVNLGWLCSRCEAAIKSRGEDLTFRENSYWDFLDEDTEPTKVDHQDESSADQLDYESDFFNCFDDEESYNLEESWLKSGDKFTLDCGNGIERYRVVSTDVNSAGDDRNDRYVIVSKEDEDGAFADEEQFTFSELAGYKRSGKLVLEAVDPFDHHDPDYSDEAAADALADRIDAAKDKKYDDALDTLEEQLPDSKITEAFDANEEVALEYTDLEFTVCGPKRDVDDWDEREESCDYTYKVNKGDVATTIWDFMTEDDAKDVAGGLEALEDNDEWEKFLETHFDELFDKYYDKVLKYYEDVAKEKCAGEYED